MRDLRDMLDAKGIECSWVRLCTGLVVFSSGDAYSTGFCVRGEACMPEISGFCQCSMSLVAMTRKNEGEKSPVGQCRIHGASLGRAVEATRQAFGETQSGTGVP